MTGGAWLEYMGVDPTEYARFQELATEVSDAMWDAALEVLREWKARDARLRALADDRCGLWEWVTVPAGTLPVGTRVRYRGRGDHGPERWVGEIRTPTADELQWYPKRVQASWQRELGGGRFNHPYTEQETDVEALLPVPFDLSALLTSINAEEGITDFPAAEPAPAPPPITWDDIQPGAIIRYQHVSRARRLARQPLVIRTARVERVYPPPLIKDGQISITALNKNGTVNKTIGRTSLFGLQFVVSVEQPAPAKENA